MIPHQSKLFFVVLVALVITACTSGTAIITGVTREPITAGQVKIYLESPAEFEVIGLVSASSDAGWTEQGSLDYAIEELKNQAAKLGANGVLLIATGDRTTVVGKYASTEKTVQGKAIFVKSQ